MDPGVPSAAATPPSPHSAGGPPDPRRLVAFVVLAYTLSWAWWVPLAFRGVVVEPGQGWPTHLPGLLGPAFAAILVTAATEGRAGISELWSRMIRWRVGWAWYAVIGATAAMSLLPVVAGSLPGADSLVRYSGAPMAGLWVVLYVLVVNGFGEETGWRGYLVEHLLGHRSRAGTALIVWPIWAAWHLPLFWIVGNFRDFGVGGTIGWVVGIGFGSVLLTWLYASARHSVFVVALWHTAYNVTTATEAAAGLAAAVATAVVIIASVVILRRPTSWRRP